ncbi:DNA (cytosine-5-)-methyltransferase [Vagococcus carniphilus]|uniref:DNA (cytosine-5-)-methyltransferase n=1 Tax=Vagococcus carniphilus TaxID=218144 RepID=UPI00289D0E03|nr:DNA (cytosine-5-)-methyltransferase [Vagococcus carniphilus]
MRANIICILYKKSYKKVIGDSVLKVIEAFSGIGSQAKALENINIDYEIVATIEWEIGAMYAYDIIHNGPQDLRNYRHHTKESLIEILSKYNLSGDGKEPLKDRTLLSMNVSQLKSILCSIDRNNNLVDVTSVSAKDLPDTDVLTYSFPCQDLSIAGIWHNNVGGIDRDAKNRSTLLWQIERILKEYVELDRALPKFLLMENVSNILSNKHIDNFNEWKSFLESIGYVNQVYTLDARNFGVPQSRVRTYMISVLAKTEEVNQELQSYFFNNSLENVILDSSEISTINNYLRLDYSIDKYKDEAIESTPAFTPSRKKIYENNPILATDDVPNLDSYARTVTTKQDRHPNSGIVEYSKTILTPINSKYRNLTPRECFLLMGFEEEDFDNLIEYNINIGPERKILPLSKLVRLAGNSIVVQVLEHIFKQIDDIDSRIFNEDY